MWILPFRWAYEQPALSFLYAGLWIQAKCELLLPLQLIIINWKTIAIEKFIMLELWRALGQNQHSVVFSQILSVLYLLVTKSVMKYYLFKTFVDPTHCCFRCTKIVYNKEKIVCHISEVGYCTPENSLKHWNTGLVSSWVSLTSWGEGASLALIRDPSSDGVLKKCLMG